MTGNHLIDALQAILLVKETDGLDLAHEVAREALTRASISQPTDHVGGRVAGYKPARFFFEVGFAACWAEAFIIKGRPAPFPLTGEVITNAWERAREDYDDPDEFDRYLELANTTPEAITDDPTARADRIAGRMGAGFVPTPEATAPEYGRIHTDGSRSGGQPVGANEATEAMVKEVMPLPAWSRFDHSDAAEVVRKRESAPEFPGFVIGWYQRLDGHRGYVLQHDPHRIVHVYPEKAVEDRAALIAPKGDAKL